MTTDLDKNWKLFKETSNDHSFPVLRKKKIHFSSVYVQIFLALIAILDFWQKNVCLIFSNITRSQFKVQVMPVFASFFLFTKVTIFCLLKFK